VVCMLLALDVLHSCWLLFRQAAPFCVSILHTTCDEPTEGGSNLQWLYRHVSCREGSAARHSQHQTLLLPVAVSMLPGCSSAADMQHL